MGFAALELQHPGDGSFSESGTKEPKEVLSTCLFISCCIARHISFIACFKVNTQQCLYTSACKQMTNRAAAHASLLGGRETNMQKWQLCCWQRCHQDASGLLNQAVYKNPLRTCWKVQENIFDIDITLNWEVWQQLQYQRRKWEYTGDPGMWNRSSFCKNIYGKALSWSSYTVKYSSSQEAHVHNCTALLL